jgi:hypothetical protein
VALDLGGDPLGQLLRHHTPVWPIAAPPERAAALGSPW